MGEYVKNKKEMKFSSMDSLKPVQKVINEASAALNDKNRTIATSAIPEVLAGAVGAGAGGAIGFAALYLGGPIVGLNAAGIAVLAAPAVLLAAGGVGLASHAKNQKLKEAKELCYKEAIKKQNAIIKALQNESRRDKERIDYLTSLNNLLKAAIRDLKYDLGI